MSNTELKPCPFCGGEAKLRECIRELPFSEEIYIFFVCCPTCGCSPFHFSEANIYFKVDFEERKAKLKNQAVEAWNRRANE